MRSDPRRGLSVGVVGATGAVGRELLLVLAQRAFPVGELRLLASARSAGRQVEVAGAAHVVQQASARTLVGLDLCFFAAGAPVARALAPVAATHGALVVDNSAAFRLDPGVPLVVPECNGAQLSGATRGIVANPNCAAILLCLVLAPLHRAAGVVRVVVSTYQAASGAGVRAVDELRAGVRAHLDGTAFTPTFLPHDLAFNLIPWIGGPQASGVSGEEDKLLYETRKILGLPDLSVDATCVRVPVVRCHSESVSVELRRDLEPAAARSLLATAPGLEVVDELETMRLPMPASRSGRDLVAVGRIRPSRVFAPGLCLWLVGDQLRKGAALNAVQIAEAVFGGAVADA